MKKFLPVFLSILWSSVTFSQESNLIGLVRGNNDSTSLIKIDENNGNISNFGTISYSNTLLESSGAYNPITGNIVLYDSDYAEDTIGIFSINVRTGKIFRNIEIGLEATIACLSYNSKTEKIYGIASYFVDGGIDTVFSVSINESNAQPEKIKGIGKQVVEPFEQIYALNSKTGNIIVYHINDNDQYVFYQVGTQTGTTIETSAPEDVLGLVEDTDSEAIYGLWLDGSTFKTIKLNETTGGYTVINEIPDLLGINSYPYPYTVSYSTVSKNMFLFTDNDAETDNELLIINLFEGTIQLIPTFNASYKGTLGFLAYEYSTENSGTSKTIMQNNTKKIDLYPNPANTHFYITNASTIKQFEVLSITGKTILNKKLLTSQNEIYISTTDLVSGLYIVKLYYNDGDVTSKRMMVE